MMKLPVPFSSSPRMSLGVELELQLLDWRTRDLCPGASRVLARLGETETHIKPEIFQSMLEVDTGICGSVAEVRNDLERAMSQLRGACDALGIDVASAGTHPFAHHRDRLLYPSSRYRDLIERNQWIARRLIIFGLHVHVGMRDGDHAIALMNALGFYLGHLLALSASSPFWAGEDTGLASSRITIFESVPTAGTPPLFSSWSEFETFHDRMVASRSIRSLKDFWWDVRPSPGYGTLELRICDAPATLSELLGIVAFVQCLASSIDEEYRSGRRFPPPPAWLLRENKWRAARHGLEADVLVDTQARSRPLRDELPRMLEELAPHATALGCAEELARVGRIVDEGGSHVRQKRVYAQTRSLGAVAEALVEELRSDCPAAV